MKLKFLSTSALSYKKLEKGISIVIAKVSTQHITEGGRIYLIKISLLHSNKEKSLLKLIAFFYILSWRR